MILLMMIIMTTTATTKRDLWLLALSSNRGYFNVLKSLH